MLGTIATNTTTMQFHTVSKVLSVATPSNGETNYSALAFYGYDGFKATLCLELLNNQSEHDKDYVSLLTKQMTSAYEMVLQNLRYGKMTNIGVCITLTELVHLGSAKYKWVLKLSHK